MKSIVTITVPARSFDLTTKATVKTELGLTNGDEDAKILVWIRQASDAISTYCHRVFAEETVSEQFRYNVNETAPKQLLLSRFPVSDVASITEDGTLLVADTDYETDIATGIVYRLDGDDNRTTWSLAKTTAVYTAGYALMDSLPFAIERAAIILVKLFRANIDRDPSVRQETVVGVLEQQFWVGSIGDNGALPPEVVSLIEPYRNFTV